MRMDNKSKELIAGYLSKAREKLEVAKNLFESGHYNDAVSRAYYCAFHAAKAMLLTEGLEANTHQGVVNLFGLHFAKTEKLDKKLGRFLAKLKDDRENGDYEIFSPIDSETAETAIKEAAEFFREAEKYLNNL